MLTLTSYSWAQQCLEGDCVNGFGEYKYPTGAIYKGLWKDGNRSGKGETISVNGEQYTGNYEDDSRSGLGIYSFPSGETYSGEWRNDLRHGFGELLYQNGITKYVGFFLNGKITGQGIKTYANGKKYDGEWLNSNYHGEGTLTAPDGEEYSGTWDNDKLQNGTFSDGDITYTGDLLDFAFHGEGTLLLPDGIKFSGTWRYNEITEGTYKNTNGATYTGEFSDGLFHGEGIYTTSNGNVYVGEFQNNNYHGNGVYTYKDGTVYTGEFVNDLRSGQGTFELASGDIYVGEFLNNQSHGQGKYTWADGSVYTGGYENNLKSGEGKLISADGDIFIGKWTNGEIIPDESSQTSTGTAFFITDQGHFLTNHHVIESCINIEAPINGIIHEVMIVASDVTNDIALGLINIKGNEFIKSSNADLQLGQAVTVAGFPLSGKLSNGVKITGGRISELSGMLNNSAEFQIDAAVQPGNSGGPILNNYGEWIGVTASMAQDDYFKELSGQYPENLNFGIKATIARELLKSKGVKTKSNYFFLRRILADTEIAQIAKAATILLQCSKLVSDDN